METKIETDNSPQARFVKNLMRKDHPELTDQQIEELYRERMRRLKESDGEDACLACGS